MTATVSAPTSVANAPSAGRRSPPGRGGAWGRTAIQAPAFALAAVIVVALAVRLWGLGWQLPWQFHPDEGHYTWKAIDLMSQETLNPKYFRNPSLFTYALLAEYRLLGFQPPKADDQASMTDGLFRPPSGVAFVGRLTSALLGVLNVLAIGWIGWRHIGPWTGVLGAQFLALAFIHVRDSHYATNDVPSVLLLTLSIGASLSLLTKPRLSAYLLAGLFGGLATSTKYNAGLFVVPLIVAHGIVVWRAWRSGGAATQSGAMNRAPTESSAVGARFIAPTIVPLVVPLALAGLVALLAYLAGTPFTILDFAKWLADFRTQASFVDEGWEGQEKLAPGVPYVLALGAGLGWVMLGLSVVGAVVLARRRPAVVAVLAAFPVAYLLFMLRSELFFVRFALPAVPFLCLLAAVAVVGLAQLAATRGRTLGLITGGALAIAALAQPTVDTVRHNVLIGRDDTRALAAQWALANVPAGAKVAVEEYTIRDRRPRAYGGPAWHLDTDLLDVNQLRRADPTAPLRGSTRYFITSSFQQDRFAGGPDSPQRQFYEALASQGRVAARFAPGRDGQPIPFDLEDLYSPFWRLDRYERPGPTITVYELPPR
ncbi:MAG TPA: glycosyltransferase family 39 protein [Chloroflexota bacterium]|nr:glycosyltransferase family 39 protein [Chloroflexota bacterium]